MLPMSFSMLRYMLQHVPQPAHQLQKLTVTNSRWLAAALADCHHQLMISCRSSLRRC
jgi:hypothetical protein